MSLSLVCLANSLSLCKRSAFDRSSQSSRDLSRTKKKMSINDSECLDLKKQLTSLSTICSVFIEREVLKTSDFIQIIFNLLNNSWCTILHQVVHRIKSLEDTTPFFRFGLDLLPKVLHDHRVIFPVVCMVSKDLKFWVWNVPVLVRGCFIEDCFVFCLREKTLFWIPMVKIQLEIQISLTPRMLLSRVS